MTSCAGLAGASVEERPEVRWSTWEPREGEYDLEWLAPVLDGIPGIPPLGRVGRALSVVDAAVGGLLGRFRR